MSRKRKTRKVGSLAPSLKPKAIAKEERSKLQKRAKNRKGLKAGHRQVLEANKGKKGARAGQPKLDEAVAEKLGSKKPVSLDLSGSSAASEIKQTPQAVKKPNKPAVAVKTAQPVKTVDIGSLSIEELEAALDALEQQPEFNLLLDLVDDGKALSVEQQSAFDQYVLEHERLSGALGITGEEPSDNARPEQGSSDDELWNNFNQGETLLKQFQKDED